MRNLLKPSEALKPLAFHNFSTSKIISDFVLPNFHPLKDSKLLSQETKGHEDVNTAAHDVYLTSLKDSGKKYVLKLMNKARFGLGSEVKEYNPEEAEKQAAMETLAMNVGNVLCRGQFAEGKVLRDGDNRYLATKFIEDSVTIRKIREMLNMLPEERDETPFYADKHDSSGMPIERLKFPNQLKKKVQRDGLEVRNAVIIGRIPLLIALYILGENDEVPNRDGNILISPVNFIINKETGIITPELKLITIDCGLCFQRPATKSNEKIIDQAFKLAVRDKESPKMGLELYSELLQSNLKKAKDDFLKNKIVPLYESGEVDNCVEEAIPHIDEDAKERIEDMKTRLTTCYLAGKCIKQGLNDPEKKFQATEYMKGLLEELEQNNGKGR